MTANYLILKGASIMTVFNGDVGVRIGPVIGNGNIIHSR